MTLADFIEANKDGLIERWKVLAKTRLSLELEESQLINALPLFIDDLVLTLRSSPEDWPTLESASEHGRQRVRLGFDIARLTEEMALLSECAVELACEENFRLDGPDMQRLIRVAGRATALSVQAYASQRDKQFADETARHFSFVAHEIRNPLNNARLAADILEIVQEQDREEHMERLHRALRQLSEQVDNSLVQARLYGTPELELETFESAELVQAACDDVAPHAEERGITITHDLEHFTLHGDRKVLVSALTNLLSNAVKFTCAGGSIRVRARAEDDRAQFEVEDECGGLAEDMPQRLFQPFVQKNKDKSGFGLGLAIVKQAVDAHDGKVQLLNRPGKGCRFIVNIPRDHGKGRI